MYFVFALTELIVEKHLRVVPLLEGRNSVTGSRTKDMLHRQEEFLEWKSKIEATEKRMGGGGSKGLREAESFQEVKLGGWEWQKYQHWNSDKMVFEWHYAFQ